MNKFWKIVLILAGFFCLVLAVLFALDFFRPGEAGIRVLSDPAAIVFVNGSQVGKTPYQATLKPGEIGLKLVPDSVGAPLAGFETRVLLSSGIETVVNRNFAETQEASFGEIISFEKTPGVAAALAVVSDPDSAQVAIDGTPRGFASYKTSAISAGQHQIGVSAPGYIERTLSVKTLTGYKLTVVVKLAADKTDVLPTPAPVPTPAAKTLVAILETPNGFLRIRENPTMEAREIGRVKDGEKLVLLDDSVKDWFKVEFKNASDATSSGWLSSQYAKKAEN